MAKTTPSARVRKLTIDDRNDGQRLDNFLIGTLKGVPRSHIYRIVRSGEVRVNSGRARPDRKLRSGDLVRIPPLRLAPSTPGSVPALPPVPVLWEDEDLMVLDKPGGLPVHAGTGLTAGLIEGLRASRPELPFLELVHRLDRDTSGCLLLAKNRRTLLTLHASLRDPDARGVTRSYTALLVGRWRGPGTRRVQTGLEKNVLRGGERMVQVSAESGRESTSLFRLLQRLDGLSLVEIELLTGRTHQARVHAAHLGMPVAGDSKYGDREANQRLRGMGLKRLFLHASTLKFRHPRHGKSVSITAPLPAELAQVVSRLGIPTP